MMPAPVRVIIATRYTLFREGVKTMLQHGRAIEVIGEAGTAKQAVSLVERLRPDVVLLDPALPDLRGEEAVRRLRTADARVKIFLIPLGDGLPIRAPHLRSQVAGHIDKHDRLIDLRSALLHSVHRRGAHAA